MLQAQLKHKLSLEQENMEDLLTSTVFGLLSYIDPDQGVREFSARAQSPDHPPILEYLGWEEGMEVTYDFWPWIEEQGCFGCEPDVILTIRDGNRVQAMVVVEAKYLSGKSSEADESDRPYDQLAREWDNLAIRAERDGARAALIYLTAGFAYPRHDIEASQVELLQDRGKKGFLYWLSWREIPELLTGAENQILTDLRGLLRDRYRLTWLRPDWNVRLQSYRWIYRASEKLYSWDFRPGAGRWHPKGVRAGDGSYAWESYARATATPEWRYTK